jgi:hypothetical protein
MEMWSDLLYPCPIQCRFHVCYVATKIIATSLIIVSNIYTRYDAETKGLHMVFTAGTNERYFGGQQGLIEAICHS